jgi:hypothetical protein
LRPRSYHSSIFAFDIPLERLRLRSQCSCMISPNTAGIKELGRRSREALETGKKFRLSTIEASVR